MIALASDVKCSDFFLMLVTTVFLMVIAAPVAYLLAYYRFTGKSLPEALIYLPMALPPTVIGSYLIIIMGPKGFAGKAWGMITGNSLFLHSSE
jgi:molybdate transport system permease protein